MFDPHLQLLPKTNVRYALSKEQEASWAKRIGLYYKLRLISINVSGLIKLQEALRAAVVSATEAFAAALHEALTK